MHYVQVEGLEGFSSILLTCTFSFIPLRDPCKMDQLQ